MGQTHRVKASKTCFSIVEFLARNGGTGVTVIANELEVPKSTVHDHLLTLTEMGYVVKDGTDYQLGTRFLEVGEMTRNQMLLYKVGRTEVDRLAKKMNEHAALMIEEEGDGVLLYATRGDDADPLPLNKFAGIRMPLHAAAPGKAILAHLDDERYDDILEDKGLQEITDRTITDRDELEAELEEIRERGFATSHSERLEGMLSIGAPVIDREGDVHGSLCVYGPIGRIENKQLEEEISEMIIRSVNVVEVNLNYS